ncbi:MAG TPA: DegT/DnrJ/EryC1/StrS family aminotransferase [Bryobacteraceae bacterium]|nr:DegT/DnrJ/EryC1/StrS family aminotransferase [Bryobacteraceae bacterium]
MTIPMVNLRPLIDSAEAAWRANLRRMFERVQFVLGEQVAAFEEELAAAFGARFAIAVGSGTSAIEIGLRAAGVGESGGEVLTSALTSPFTAQAILAAGCRPRFADVDESTLLIDAEDAAARVGKRSVALLPVHLYGQPCALQPLAALARRRGIVLVQDACQAHGARDGGREFTRRSPAVAYSFYPTKNLPCLGDGGAVLTDSAPIAGKLRLLRDGGRRNGGQVAFARAVNSRLDEMQACYLRAFLPKLAAWNAERVRLASLYDEALAGCAGARPIGRHTGSVCHLYVVRAVRRERLRKFLADQGIATAVHYPEPLHLHPAFRDSRTRRGAFPRAERACREIVSLPLWPGMPDIAVERVAAAILRFYGE